MKDVVNRAAMAEAGSPHPWDMVRDVEPHTTRHDLRHTAASLAGSARANVKAVQRMLRHASAAMTLDIYAEVVDDDLEAVATALDNARSRASVGNTYRAESAITL
jgi:integrase